MFCSRLLPVKQPGKSSQNRNLSLSPPNEVREYLPRFAEKYDLPLELLVEVLELLPITIYAEHEYADEIAAAHDLLAHRDPDDVALAALALHLQIPIWSNDRDYEHFPLGVITTAKLLKMLEL